MKTKIVSASQANVYEILTWNKRQIIVYISDESLSSGSIIIQCVMCVYHSKNQWFDSNVSALQCYVEMGTHELTRSILHYTKANAYNDEDYEEIHSIVEIVQKELKKHYESQRV